MLNISLFCVYLSDGKNTIPIFCVSSFIRLLIFSFSLVTIWSIGWLFSLFLLWLSDQLVGIFSLSLFWHTPTRSVVVFLLLFTFFFLISHSLLSVLTYLFRCYLSPFIYFLLFYFSLSFVCINLLVQLLSVSFYLLSCFIISTLFLSLFHLTVWLTYYLLFSLSLSISF